ncbi:hypothetical protein [Dactylosporangium sp. NPDC048998]|uniref:hypothetical protein n=1 Tax=Dactylosporangium sp. NPDC048998 TaxID=3363976 RepID=UPI0037142C62
MLRHAGQQAGAEVLLRAAPESVTVEVTDNGSGPGAGQPDDPSGVMPDRGDGRR